MESTTTSFTGRSRNRKTRWTVRAADIAARGLITFGGIGTIVAVLTVCVFLVWVVAPLFFSPTVFDSAQFKAPWKSDQPLHVALDEYEHVAWALFPDGVLRSFALKDGQLLAEQQLFPGRTLTAASFPISGSHVAFGFADGTIQLGQIGFATLFLDDKDLPALAANSADLKKRAPHGGVIIESPDGQSRLQRVEVKLADPIKSAAKASVILIDQIVRPTGPVVCFMTADGKLNISSVREKTNLISRKVTQQLSSGALPAPPSRGGKSPSHLLLSGLGDNVLLIWDDGHLVRYDTRDIKKPQIAEEINFLGKTIDSQDATLTAAQFLLGESTLIVGDSLGRLGVWFRINKTDASTKDGTMMVKARELAGPPDSVTSLAASARSRMVTAGYAGGQALLFHVTSGERLLEIPASASQPVASVAMSPKDTGVLVATNQDVYWWSFDPRHPEANLTSLFRPVWYEGYPEPAHVWQSSSGVDSFEPKLGLWPLIFGTIKATTYSMFFGVPLALLAAIFTSEFLHPRVKSKIKPTIELMASLPSVVLGFLAALVFAPYVEQVAPAALISFITVPAAFLTGAYLWQLLPFAVSARIGQYRFLVICAALPLGVWLAYRLGPVAERILFDGNLMRWLDGNTGSPLGGWILLTLPISAVVAGLLMIRVVDPWVRSRSRDWSRAQSALADLLKFCVGALLALAGAVLVSYALTSLGFDARGTVIGSYVQRNSLVVGFVMGFAIIPIIYTISEDALSAVPEHLRSASLGAGATRWQTAVRIIIPTAMSGLFSAIMVGLGRAVGETMIVLMAAGNTPVMEWNIFNGFRTLSANIAVELPEAVRDSTHYRTLFLAALTLFVITFVLNTVAEIIRMRFRRRAFQL